MPKPAILEKLKGFFKKFPKGRRPFQADEVGLALPCFFIRMKRDLGIKDSHEFTVVVPRAEFRKKIDEDRKTVEYEVVLNSITVVHAPRHPPAGPPS